MRLAIKGYIIFSLIIILTFVLALFACNEDKITQVALTKRQIDEAIKLETVDYKHQYFSSLKIIDSLNNLIAFKDSNLNLILGSIQNGLQNISDEGLMNLINMRNK